MRLFMFAVSINVYIHVCMLFYCRISMFFLFSANMQVYMYIYIYISVYLYICDMYIFISCIDTYIYIYIFVYIYIFIYIYIYLYTLQVPKMDPICLFQMRSLEIHWSCPSWMGLFVVIISDCYFLQGHSIVCWLIVMLKKIANLDSFGRFQICTLCFLIMHEQWSEPWPAICCISV